MVEILDVFSSDWTCDKHWKDGTVYVALEYMDGGSIDNIKSKLGIPEDPLAYILRQVLSGVSTHHDELKQIHRNLCLPAVLFNSRGDVKITSIPPITAGMINPEPRANNMRDNLIRITLAPERLQGKEYGYPSDIWSVGIIAMELATGEYPFDTTVKCHLGASEPVSLRL